MNAMCSEKYQLISFYLYRCILLSICAVKSDSKNKHYKLVSLDLHLKWLQLQSHMPYLFPSDMPAAVARPAVSQQESPRGTLIVDAWSFLDLEQMTRFLTESFIKLTDDHYIFITDKVSD